MLARFLVEYFAACADGLLATFLLKHSGLSDGNFETCHYLQVS